MEELVAVLDYENAPKMEKRTLLSILVPLYNKEGSLQECLRRIPVLLYPTGQT
jgi:hypothetical protein